MTDKNRNLLFRVLTAAVLLPLVIWLIWEGGLWFALLIAGASAFSALELNLMGQAAPATLPAPPPLPELTRKERKQARAAAAEAQVQVAEAAAQPTGAAIASAGGAFLIALLHHAPLPFVSVELVLAAVTLLAFCDALFFEQDLQRAPRRVGMAVLGAVYCGLLLAALVRLRQLDGGPWWIILALTVTWANDTGAYFTGRALGKRKLYPRISPSKTWEGAIGGAASSVAGGLVVAFFWLHQLPLWGAALIGLGAAVLGPLGDLSESMLKRAFGAKDSGRMLPGHGGLLDRIDALLFTAPFVLLCARLLR